MITKLLTFEDLEKDYLDKKVWVIYDDTKWNLPRHDIHSGYHTVCIDRYNILDLQDSEGCFVGCIKTCIEDKEIYVFNRQPLLSEIMILCNGGEI